MYLIRLVVLKRPGFQSQKYGMYLRLLVRLLHNAMLRVHSSTLQYSTVVAYMNFSFQHFLEKLV